MMIPKKLEIYKGILDFFGLMDFLDLGGGLPVPLIGMVSVGPRV
jgi:hypothetical protein